MTMILFISENTRCPNNFWEGFAVGAGVFAALALIVAIFLFFFKGNTTSAIRVPTANQVAEGIRQANNGAQHVMTTAGRVTTALDQIRNFFRQRQQADGQEEQQQQQPIRENGARRGIGVGPGISIPIALMAANLPSANACAPHDDPTGFDMDYDSCKFLYFTFDLYYNC